MNLIQKFCLHMSMDTVNGKVTNPVPDPLLEELTPEAANATVWQLLADVSKVRLETHYKDTNVEIFQRNRLKNAYLYFHGINKPLVLDLMPSHMCFPRFPQQLFAQTKSGELSVTPNPYYDGALNNVYAATTRLYLGLLKCCGMPTDWTENSILESVTIYPATRKVVRKRSPKLNENLLADMKGLLQKAIIEDREAHIELFVRRFIPGMLKKSEQSFVPVMHDGRTALQNTFTPVDWSDNEKAQHIEKHIHLLSFESWPDAPPFMHHNERLRVYVKKIINDVLQLPIPLTKKNHGLDCKSLEEFFATPSGEMLVTAYTTYFFDMLSENKITFGDLLERCEKLGSVAVN
jgi:hypothetical protein